MVQKTQQWRWSHQMYIMKQDQTSICPAQLSPVLLPSFSGLWMEHCCPIRDQNSVWRTFRPVRVVATAAGPIIPEPWGTRHLSPLTSLCWVSGREEIEIIITRESNWFWGCHGWTVCAQVLFKVLKYTFFLPFCTNIWMGSLLVCRREDCPFQQRQCLRHMTIELSE